jgi:hypothetical protein
MRFGASEPRSLGASAPANAIVLGEDGVNRQQSTAITVNRQVC